MLLKSSRQISLLLYFFQTFFPSKLGCVGASNSVLMDLDFKFFKNILTSAPAYYF